MVLVAMVLDGTDISIIAESSIGYLYSRVAIKRIYNVTSKLV